MKKIKANNGVPESIPGKNFGSHFDGNFFYFWESKEEADEEWKKLASRPVDEQNQVPPLISPILDLKLRRNSQLSALSYMPLFNFSRSANVDYYVYRFLFLSENHHFLVEKLVKTAGDCIEKLLKCYLLSFNPSLNLKEDFSHGLSRIRLDCASIDPYFDKKELSVFCDQYSQKMDGYNGHQIFGYSDGTVVEGWQADLQQILELLDEVFLETIIRMKSEAGLFYFDIFAIYLGHKTATWKYIAQPGKFEEVKKTYFTNNKTIESFCKMHEKILDQIQDIPDISS